MSTVTSAHFLRSAPNALSMRPGGWIRRSPSGEPLEPLAGVPVAIKDNMVVRDMPTTCASEILEGYIPPYTATAVERLRSAGAIIVGKTNCDEFAMGSTTENSGYFVTRNPHNLDRVPGGSSGGSAASVASGTSLIALGSDTGGSVRTPAAFCGVVGVKPTYGRVSRYGLVAFGSSLDQIGPLSKSVREAAQTLESDLRIRSFRFHIGRHRRGRIHARRSTSRSRDTKIGIPKEYFIAGLDREVRAKIEAGMRIYEEPRMRDAGDQPAAHRIRGRDLLS